MNQNGPMVIDLQSLKKRKRKSTAKNTTATKRMIKHLPTDLDKIKLNFDESSSCSSMSMNSENFDSDKFDFKVKQKSRQRKAANERERKRMSNINKAFDKLRAKCTDKGEKLSKMDILKLAQSVILQLKTKLSEPPNDSDSDIVMSNHEIIANQC